MKFLSLISVIVAAVAVVSAEEYVHMQQGDLQSCIIYKDGKASLTAIENCNIPPSLRKRMPQRGCCTWNGRVCAGCN
ncbi:hypothetical protein BC940DRAFT_103347 [Gongronella butleri]|nr:hypothetical protein BC940DRAFT_103347 [Gongronella butleri]